MDGDTEKAVSTYARETWQNVEVHVDCIEGTYDAYINGKLVVDGFDLPMDYENTYAVRITADKLGSSTNSYTYIDNLKFYKSEAMVEELTLTIDEAEYVGGDYFYCAGNVSGYISSTANVYILFAVYDANGNLIHWTKTPYENGNFEIQDIENISATNADYVKAFVWNMTTLVPLGASTVY